MPDTLLVPEYLNTALVEDSIYYKIENIPIHKFIRSSFIDLFVKKGRPLTILVSLNLYRPTYYIIWHEPGSKTHSPYF